MTTNGECVSVLIPKANTVRAQKLAADRSSLDAIRALGEQRRADAARRAA